MKIAIRKTLTINQTYLCWRESKLNSFCKVLACFTEELMTRWKYCVRGKLVSRLSWSSHEDQDNLQEILCMFRLVWRKRLLRQCCWFCAFCVMLAQNKQVPAMVLLFTAKKTKWNICSFCTKTKKKHFKSFTRRLFSTVHTLLTSAACRLTYVSRSHGSGRKSSASSLRPTFCPGTGSCWKPLGRKATASRSTSSSRWVREVSGRGRKARARWGLWRQLFLSLQPASARGIGIHVIHKWSQVPIKRSVLVQK